MNHFIGLDKNEINTIQEAMKIAYSRIIDIFSRRNNLHILDIDDLILFLIAFPIIAMTSHSVALDINISDETLLANAWNKARELVKKIPIPECFEPLIARVIEKRGICPGYEVGDEFEILSPFYWPKRCPGLWFSAWPYIIAAGFGYKSWEVDNQDVFRISCPSKKGIVIEMIQRKSVETVK